jgi:hypothetical protein
MKQIIVLGMATDGNQKEDYREKEGGFPDTAMAY